jgi:hypothetical protein
MLQRVRLQKLGGLLRPTGLGGVVVSASATYSLKLLLQVLCLHLVLFSLLSLYSALITLLELHWPTRIAPISYVEYGSSISWTRTSRGPVLLRPQRSQEDIPYHFKKGVVCQF